MLIKVNKAVYFRDYQLKILFSNGKTKMVDFEKWIFESSNSPYLEPRTPAKSPHNPLISARVRLGLLNN